MAQRLDEGSAAATARSTEPNTATALTIPEDNGITDQVLADITIEALRVSAQLSGEFPELIEDSKRLSRGEPVQTQLFRRTALLLSQRIDSDPSINKSPATVLLVARTAREQLAVELKVLDAALSQAYLLLDARVPGWRSFSSEISSLSFALTASVPPRTPEAIADYLNLLYLCALGSFSASKEKEVVQ